MPDDRNPLEEIMGDMQASSSLTPDSSATTVSGTPDPEPDSRVEGSREASGGGEAPRPTRARAASSPSRSRSSRPRSDRAPRRRPSASSFPPDWIAVQVSVPEEVNNRAGSQMRPQRVGLTPGEGKTPGRRFALSIKLAAVDKFLGSDLDTTGFVFGNEPKAIQQVEDAILEKAAKILESRGELNRAA